MIQLLHLRYSDEELVHLTQYQKLMALYNSLRPLLPQNDDDNPVGDAAAAEGVEKRYDLDFMGMKVSYPQYIRLMNLQQKVNIKMLKKFTHMTTLQMTFKFYSKCYTMSNTVY